MKVPIAADLYMHGNVLLLELTRGRKIEQSSSRDQITGVDILVKEETGWGEGCRAPSFGIQELPLRSSGADRVNPMDSGDLSPSDQTSLNNSMR